MAYTTGVKASAAKSLEKLSRQLRDRILDRVETLADHPRPSGSTKLTGHSTFYRIRIGDYRVVYDIDDAKERIEITIVAHRPEAYRGL